MRNLRSLHILLLIGFLPVLIACCCLEILVVNKLTATVDVIGCLLLSIILLRIGYKLLVSPFTEIIQNSNLTQKSNLNSNLIDNSTTNGTYEVNLVLNMINNLISTLNIIESKLNVLLNENLDSLKLLEPIPGELGRSIQESINKLTERIQEREYQRHELHNAANYDGLTGLFNRQAVFDYLETDIKRRIGNEESIAILFIDLDKFKPINDNYGHHIGDKAIIACGGALKEATRQCDVVARMGGDEFIVVLCEKDSLDASSIAEHISDTVAKKEVLADNGDRVNLQASIGIVVSQCNRNTNISDLIREADEAMYEAKHQILQANQ